MKLKYTLTFLSLSLLLAGSARAADDAFEIRRGFFVEADAGMHWTLMGKKLKDSAGQWGPTDATFSEVQLYQGLTVGYDLTRSFSMGLHLANGFTGGLARPEVVDDAWNGGDTATVKKTALEDYAIHFVGLEFTYSYLFHERVSADFTLGGGGAFVTPGLKRVDDGTEFGTGGYGGAGVGLTFHTLLTGFTIGAELDFNYVVIGDSGIPSAAVVFPVKYTF